MRTFPNAISSLVADGSRKRQTSNHVPGALTFTWVNNHGDDIFTTLRLLLQHSAPVAVNAASRGQDGMNMLTINNSVNSAVQNGWQCTLCGAWVGYLDAHTCKIVMTSFSYPPPRTDREVLEDILAELRKMNGLLASLR